MIQMIASISFANRYYSRIVLNCSERKRLAFLDMLIESSKDGEVLSDADIAEEVDTFMFAVSFSFQIYRELRIIF